MVAIASERSRRVVGKVVSCDGGDILQAELSIDKSSIKSGRTLECPRAPLRETTTPTG